MVSPAVTKSFLSILLLQTFNYIISITSIRKAAAQPVNHQPQTGNDSSHTNLSSGILKPGHALKVKWKLCQRLFKALRPQDAEHLRLLHSIWALQDRRRIDLAQQVENKQKPSDRETVNRAFKDNANIALTELQQRYAKADNGSQWARQQLEAELTRLQGIGALSKEATRNNIGGCVASRLNPSQFPDVPRVSFILQYFKRPWMIGKLVEVVQECNQMFPVELVVNVDSGESATDWAAFVANTSGLVVPVLSNNVHEIRAYNRAARLARGKFLIFLQDDQLPPKDCNYLNITLSIFGKYPLLAAMGHRAYRYSFDGHLVKENMGEHYEDPTLGVKMQFVQAVDFAPLMVRRSVFREVGGLDEYMSNVGECGIWSDFELSQRIMGAGYQVAWRFLDGMQGDGSREQGGTHTVDNGHRCWGRQQGGAISVYSKRWESVIRDEFTAEVLRLNTLHLRRIPNTACPFSCGCDQASIAAKLASMQQA